MARRKRADTEQAIFDAELADMPADLRWREWMNRIEAVLFAAPKPVEREALARIVGRDASIELLIDDIRESLRGKPYDVLNIAGGWAFRTRIAYHDAIAASAAVPERGIDLTQNEAMVLVSIAYHQPITRAGVSEILGREVSRDVIGALRDKNMIAAGPRSPTAGAPFTYVTTKGFLEHFGLDTLRDIPGLDELEDAGLLGQADKSVGGSPITGESEGERGPAPE
jgi:segregation and condensation protein B